jgi:Leucine-rich repeat (LRR) protein
VSKNPDLTTIPPFFDGFPRLVEFYAFNCKIEVLPEEMARCKLLTKIMVASNRLSSIPDPVARSAVSRVTLCFFPRFFELAGRCWRR